MGALRISSLRWIGALLLGLSACSSQSPDPVKQSPTQPAPAPVAENRPEPVAAIGRMWEGKALLMHYMPWYETPQGRGQWGAHWTGHEKQCDPDKIKENGLPDIWSHYHPLIGPYDSADPDALECHLLQMKLAGIDGVVADWYGPVAFHDYGPIHQASQALFHACEKFGMKFVACFEDRTIEVMVKDGGLKAEEVPGHLRKVIDWCKSEWFSQPHYFKMEGKPLLTNFGPIYVQERETWQQALGDGSNRPALYCLPHLREKAGADGGYSWVHFEAWEGNPDSATLRQRLAEIYNRISPHPQQTIVSALPGFDDIYAKSYGHIDFRNGDTLRDSLGVCMEGPWPVVQLVTWNDYGEGTMFEPTHEQGYLALEIVQEARRKEGGGKFPFSAEDLRLPARLYAFRKTPAMDSVALDKISQLLNAGKCGEAKQALDALQPVDGKGAN